MTGDDDDGRAMPGNHQLSGEHHEVVMEEEGTKSVHSLRVGCASSVGDSPFIGSC